MAQKTKKMTYLFDLLILTLGYNAFYLALGTILNVKVLQK